MTNDKNAPKGRMGRAHIALRLFLTLVGIALAVYGLTVTFITASALPLPLFAAAVTLAALSITRRAGHAFAISFLPIAGSLVLLGWPGGGPVSWIIFATTIVVARVIDLAVPGHRFVWQ